MTIVIYIESAHNIGKVPQLYGIHNKWFIITNIAYIIIIYRIYTSDKCFPSMPTMSVKITKNECINYWMTN